MDVSSSTPDVPENEGGGALAETSPTVSAANGTTNLPSSTVPNDSGTVMETPGENAASSPQSVAQIGMISPVMHFILVTCCYIVAKMAN